MILSLFQSLRPAVSFPPQVPILSIPFPRPRMVDVSSGERELRWLVTSSSKEFSVRLAHPFPPLPSSRLSIAEHESVQPDHQIGITLNFQYHSFFLVKFRDASKFYWVGNSSKFSLCTLDYYLAWTYNSDRRSFDSLD